MEEMRRSRYRRQELILYRILILCAMAVVAVFLIKGVVALASDGVKAGAKRLGVNFIQSVYLSISSNENHLFSYVASDKKPQETLFASLAEELPINHYAMHQGKVVLEYEEEEKTEEEDFWYYLADGGIQGGYGLYEDESTVVTDSDLVSEVEDENQELLNSDSEGTLEIHYSKGGVEMLPEYKEALIAAQKGEKLDQQTFSVQGFIKSQYDMNKLLDYDYLISNFYIVDGSTVATQEIFDVDKLLNMDMSIDKTSEGPQILIYHTHATEAYIDSKPGVEADTVVGAGSYLTKLLESYGYVVYHDTTAYDRKPNGEGNRNYAYSTARPSIEKILEENPTIEVVIDLHRDSGPKRVTTINGKDTAKVMLFNGLSRNKSGPIQGLENPNLQSNLAFSLQTALVGRKLYSGFVHRNYLKNYRYNMHLSERAMLIELGTANNTVMEAYNAMEPLANILHQVLSNP